MLKLHVFGSVYVERDGRPLDGAAGQRRVLALLTLLAVARGGVSDAATYANIAIARLYERLGDSRAALAAVRRRGYMSGWPRYLATARREENRLTLAQ